MEDRQISEKYNQLLREILVNYLGYDFTYELDAQIMPGKHTLVGIVGSKLELMDSSGRSSYLSASQFLDPVVKMVEPEQTPVNPAQSTSCSCGGIETVVSSPIDTVETCRNCGKIRTEKSQTLIETEAAKKEQEQKHPYKKDDGYVSPYRKD
jgi:hypothetical protein